MRVFLDANVLFSAANAGSGISRLAHYLADHHEVITSHYAEQEAARNVASKRPGWRDDYADVMQKIEIKPGLDRPLDIEIAEKDRPILATAIKEHCDYLVTGDARHFGHLFGRKIGESLEVVTPLAMSEILEEQGRAGT